MKNHYEEKVDTFEENVKNFLEKLWIEHNIRPVRSKSLSKIEEGIVIEFYNKKTEKAFNVNIAKETGKIFIEEENLKEEIPSLNILIEKVVLLKQQDEISEESLIF